MKFKLLSCLAATGILFSAFGAVAGNSQNMNSGNKPISHVSDIKNMPDDTMVYIQGYLTQNNGGEMYTFQDDSGTLMVEIDDDLMQPNMNLPTTMVWIAAEVDRDGDVVSLDAEEIQILPDQSTQASN